MQLLLRQLFGITEVESNDLEYSWMHFACSIYWICNLGDQGRQMNPRECVIAFGIIAACAGLYILLGWF
jgi:hypothetical protein